MTPQQQYITEQTELCRGWFKTHKASIVTVTPDVTLIGWENPKSWNYGCRYIIHRRWLTVVGDIGEAVFEWGQDITSEFMLQIQFDYFLGKCRASPTGTKFEQWDARVAYQAKENYLANDLDFSSRSDEIAAKSVKDLGKGVCKDDYDFAGREIYDKTNDAELAGMVATFGVVPSCHAIGMFVGLQMALTQLKEAKV